MRTGTLAFMLGIVAVQFFSQLPPVWFAAIPLLLLVLCLVFCRRHKRLHIILFSLSAGFVWALLHAHSGLSASLPTELEGKNIVLRGVVSDLPHHDTRISRFNFKVHEYRHHDGWQASNWYLRLKWYGKQRPLIKSGQYWQFTVRLKRPHGLANPGGFDYEKWLFEQGISATGYVRSKAAYKMLDDNNGFAFWQGWREHLISVINTSLHDHRMLGLVRALAVGDRSAMTQQHWDVLTRTGTSHLVAISGLHIGLVAGFFFWISLSLVKRSVTLCSWQPAKIYAAVIAVIAALLYAALAGFAIPTQRAMIMITIVMLAVILRRGSDPLNILTLTLLVILLFDPLSVLSVGFWLSFFAVAVILMAVNGHLSAKSAYRQWGSVQWAVSLGLMPLVILFFGRMSLVAPVVNLLAVPWVSFISAPLLLLSIPVLLFESDWLIRLAADSLQLLWFVLEWASALPVASINIPAVPVWGYLLAGVGVLIALLPRGIPLRWASLPCLLPVLLLGPDRPVQGDYHLNVLDVGQGLAVVVDTGGHTFVYDAGARLSSRFDMGSAVVLPVLRHSGINRIDVLVVSHGDNDHSGGVNTILNTMQTDRVLAGDPGVLPIPAEHCQAGQVWQWQAVKFEVLYPPANKPLAKKTNNRSCVLRISNGRYSVLLTGDIESAVERELINTMPNKLQADILVVPHHGSKSSSTRQFIETVNAEHVVFSVGYRNRYGFPHSKVLQRYRETGSTIYQTDKTGMLRFRLGADGPLRVDAWRAESRRYWHAQ